MIKFEPNALYSRTDLTALLDGSGVDPDFFVAKIRPRKIFKQLWLGADLLAALATAPALSEREPVPAVPEARNKGNRTRRGGAIIVDPLEPLKRLRERSR